VIRRRLLSPAAVLAALVVLAGCSFAPDPVEVQSRASATFDQLTTALAAVDAAVLRSVEVLPEASRPCAEEGQQQSALLARGMLSIRADDAAAQTVVDDLAGSLDAATWTEVASSSATSRAWASEDGVTVTLTNAAPTVVVAVFPPCTAGSPGPRP